MFKYVQIIIDTQKFNEAKFHEGVEKLVKEIDPEAAVMDYSVREVENSLLAAVGDSHEH